MGDEQKAKLFCLMSPDGGRWRPILLPGWVSARSNCLRMEKSPQKGLMLLDLSCIFAMLVLTYIVDLGNTNLGEICPFEAIS